MGNLVFLTIPYMTWLSRMAGGGWPKLPWGLDQWLLAAPYLLFYDQIGWWVIPAYLGAVVGLRLGHGRGFHYRLPFKEGSKPEAVEAVIPKSLPIPVRKILIMALTGLAVTLVLAVCLAAYGHWLRSLIVAVSGIAKALAYCLPSTELSEYARGGLLGCGVTIARMIG